MFGWFSASRRARSTISLLLLFLFTVLLDYSSDDLDVGGDVSKVEHGSDDLFSRNQSIRLGDAHMHIVARPPCIRKMAETGISAVSEARLAGAAEG